MLSTFSTRNDMRVPGNRVAILNDFIQRFKNSDLLMGDTKDSGKPEGGTKVI